ncbi:membrane protein [Rhodococcus phage Jflix2]|nr:membrane protein [Rhodococcus phage Jflix2]
MRPETLTLIITMVGLLIGSNGITMWRTERLLKTSQSEQAKAMALQATASANSENIDAAAQLSQTVLGLLAPLQSQINDYEVKLRDAVTYIADLRSDMARSGVTARPLPKSLQAIVTDAA